MNNELESYQIYQINNLIKNRPIDSSQGFRNEMEQMKKEISNLKKEIYELKNKTIPEINSNIDVLNSNVIPNINNNIEELYSRSDNSKLLELHINEHVSEVHDDLQRFKLEHNPINIVKSSAIGAKTAIEDIYIKLVGIYKTGRIE